MLLACTRLLVVALSLQLSGSPHAAVDLAVAIVGESGHEEQCPPEGPCDDCPPGCPNCHCSNTLRALEPSSGLVALEAAVRLISAAPERPARPRLRPELPLPFRPPRAQSRTA